MDFIQMTRDLGSAIQATQEYKDLVAAKAANDQDPALEKMIGEFNLKRIEMNNITNTKEWDSDRMKELDKEIRDIYEEIMKNEHMAAYNAAKQKMDGIMNQISMILMMSVNGEDPQTCDITASCSGSCDSCGGCH